MPKPKKQKKAQPRNAYAIFVDEFLDRRLEEGVRMTRVQAFREADTEWKVISMICINNCTETKCSFEQLEQALNETAKQYYERMAAEEKAAARQNVGRIDSTGQLVSAVENEMEEQRRELESKADTITTIIKNRGSMEAVADLKFCMISFNIFCRTEKGVYLPAEVGLVEFSIAKGIIQTYHDFIAPGPIPQGYTFKCMEHSDRTHKIPMDFELAQQDYAVVYRRICEMINSSDGTPWNDVGQAVFCLPEDMIMTEYLLSELRKGSRNSPPPPVVYDITVLFLELYFYAGQCNFSTGLARDQLNMPSYNYSPNISCEWHFDQDNQPNCSLGVVKRSCYLMADMLCPEYGINLIPSFHMPDNSNSDVVYTSRNPTSQVATPRPPSSARSRPSPSTSSYVPTASLASSNRSSYLPQNSSHYVPSVAASVSSISSSTYASAASRPPSSYVEAAWGPSSNQSFTINSGDFPSISNGGGSRSGRDSVLSNVSMSSQGTIDHQPVYSSEIASVSGSVSSAVNSERSQTRDPNTAPFVMGLKGIGRGQLPPQRNNK